LIPRLASDSPGELEEFWLRAASTLNVPQILADTLAREPPETRREFRQLLSIIRGRSGGLLLIGRPISFQKMSPAQREQALFAMANSNIAKLRQGFQAIKRLTTFIFYSAPLPDGRDNPNWPVISFAPPPPPPATPKRLHPLAITHDMKLDTDVIVVGSGAGGGVVAAELAKAGKSVIILEKGGYYSESDFTGREAEMMPKLYLKRGLQSTRDLSVMLLAGSCVGGGTTVNWSTSFRIPDEVRLEWENSLGLSDFGKDLDTHYASVEERIGVNLEHSKTPNPSNLVIERGCTKLGYHWEMIPANANHCEGRCGACGYGCPYSTKQSTMVTYLQDATDLGARLIVNCSVDRVLIERGTTTGVSATVTDPTNGVRYNITIHAPRVVIAAGSLHSPAILLRSGIRNPNLGRNLWLHPVAAVIGFYEDPIRSWEGSLQTRYSDQFAHADGDYGFKFEVAPAHPGLIGMTVPWENGRSYKALMLDAAHVAPMIVLVRDRNSGRITLDRHGEPIVDYPLGTYEKRMLMLGMQHGARVHAAAGALRVGTLHSRPLLFDTSPDMPEERWKKYDQGVIERGLQPNRSIIFSAHQMGTCRMAGNMRQGVINNDNLVWDVRGLYVADASTFPTASGCNPMLTIMAIAHRAAQAILAGM
jgi:choline dehydrogenase-like flavoprotein